MASSNATKLFSARSALQVYWPLRARIDAPETPLVLMVPLGRLSSYKFTLRNVTIALSLLRC